MHADWHGSAVKNMENPRRRYWPYDEVKASREDGAKLVVSAPWLTFHIDINPQDADRAGRIAKKISAGQISADDLNDINWLFSSLSSYPFAYVLPRPSPFGTDQHVTSATTLNLNSPRETLAGLGLDSNVALTHDWTWDTDAALGFSKTDAGFDPETLFSVARRFHLLNDMDNNKTAELLTFMGTLPKGSAEFRDNSALVMRQNHFITEKCEAVLSAALPLAQNAEGSIREFIQAEKGHDKILSRALHSLGADAQQVPVLDCVRVLMELFQLIATRNLLAFSMVVDIFERTSYHGNDPFAKVLQDGGEILAASQIELHRDINDSGGHENVAIGFLKDMQPVSADYAVEALRLSELLTQVIHQLSAETLTRFRSTL